jgi:DNA modification methylase
VQVRAALSMNGSRTCRIGWHVADTQGSGKVLNMELRKGDALDLISAMAETPDLVVTDPPYALRGDGDEHAISATVAIVLREAAVRLRKGGWMLVMCASSWRSQAYMVESVRGILEPIRTLTWCKPVARTRAKTSGPAFASVQVLVFKKGKSDVPPSIMLDHITAEPVKNGRRAELPWQVAEWMVTAYGKEGDLLLDPFAGSGAILKAAERYGIRSIGFEKNPLAEAA